MSEQDELGAVLDRLYKPDVQLAELPEELREVVLAYARSSGQEELLTGEFVGKLTAEALWAVWQQYGRPTGSEIVPISRRAKKWTKSLLPIVRCVLPAIEMDEPLQRIEAVEMLADHDQVIELVSDEALTKEIGKQARRLVEWDGEIKRNYANWWKDGLDLLFGAVVRAGQCPAAIKPLAGRVPAVRRVDVELWASRGVGYWVAQGMGLVLQSGQLVVLALIAVVLIAVAGGLWVLRPWEVLDTAVTETVTPLPAAVRSTATRTGTPAPAAQPTPTSVDAESLSDAQIVRSVGRMERMALLLDSTDALHLFWLETEGMSGQVWHKQKATGGVWTEVEPLAAGFEQMGSSLHALRDPRGQVCVFWEGATVSSNPDTLGLYARCREGQGWSAARMVMRVTSMINDLTPAFAPDGTVRMLYRYGIGEVRLGETTVGKEGDAVGSPVLVVDAQGGYHAAWVRLGAPFRLEYRYLADVGQTWGEVQVLSDAETLSGGSLRLAADRQGSVHLVWAGNLSCLFYRRWTASEGWSAVEKVSQRGGDAGSLCLTTSADGLAHLAWLAWDGLYEAHQDVDGGWRAPVRLVELLHESSVNVQIAVDETGTRHFVWPVKEGGGVTLYEGALAGERN